MTDTLMNLGTIETDYTVFEKDQVLTPDQLNSVAGYLDDQERVTRVALLGVGIACGLWPSIRKGRVRLSHGVGVTTDGDVLFMPEATLYDRYKAYDSSAPTYPPFRSGSSVIPAFELTRDDQDDDSAKPLAGFAAAEGRALESMAAVLYVESYLHDKDLCSGTDCDNRGKDWVHATKLLLVDASSAAALATALDTPDRAARTPLAPVTIARARLQGPLTTEKDLAAAYEAACNAIYKPLVSALRALYKPCQWFLQDLAPDDPAPRWQKRLDAVRQSISIRGMQYYYDFLKDLAETYNAFRDALLGDTAVCCPRVDAFPKHLVLGSLDPSLRAAAGRTGFHPSPMVSDRFEQRAHARFLIRKLDALINAFAEPAAGDIRITPSAFEDRSLEERAIPFYYVVREDLPLYRVWSYRLAQRGMERYNYSYNADRYGAAGGASAPFDSQIGAFNFFRIEGHVGSSVADAAQKLRNQIRQQNLPITVQTVLLGKDRTKVIDPPFRHIDLSHFHYVLRNDVAAQLNEGTDYGKSFATQVASAVDGKLVSNDDAGEGIEVKGIAANASEAFANSANIATGKLVGAVYNRDSNWLGDVYNAAGAAVQMRQKLSPITKNDFASPFDAILAGPQTRWLTWLDTIIKDASDKEADRLLLTAYLAEHPGLEHYAGVLRGGTFVLAHDESNTVVADFMLPYAEHITEAPKPPKLDPLPKPPILIDKPIRIAAFPDKVRFEKIRTDFLNDVKKDVAAQTTYVSGLKDTLDIFLGAKAGVGFGTAGGFNPSVAADPVLDLNIRDMAVKGQKVDLLRTRLLELGPDDPMRPAIETQLEASEGELSSAILTTTQYVASTGTDLAPGSDGAKAISTASAAFTKVSDINALANLEKGLTSLGNKAATTPAARTAIGNLLAGRGFTR